MRDVATPCDPRRETLGAYLLLCVRKPSSHQGNLQPIEYQAVTFTAEWRDAALALASLARFRQDLFTHSGHASRIDSVLVPTQHQQLSVMTGERAKETRLPNAWVAYPCGFGSRKGGTFFSLFLAGAASFALLAKGAGGPE